MAASVVQLFVEIKENKNDMIWGLNYGKSI
jgi:hypothetical protein